MHRDLCGGYMLPMGVNCASDYFRCSPASESAIVLPAFEYMRFGQVHGAWRIYRPTTLTMQHRSLDHPTVRIREASEDLELHL